MTGKEFIFSNKQSLRIKRHLLFWLVFILQQLVLYADLKKPGDFFTYTSYKPAVTFILCILPVCIFLVYTSLNILFPFFQKKRYREFIVVGIIVLIANYFLAQFFYQIARHAVCADCGAISLREKISMALNIGINIAGFLSTVALGIKFTLHWYQQQTQNRLLSKQKISSELKLLKARIQPDFMFESLHSIYKTIDVDNNDAAEILIKFSDLLSYILYECNNDFVLLERELIITNNYIELERIIRQTNFIIDSKIIRFSGTQYILSFTTLSIVQNCITALHNTSKAETNYIKIEINTAENILDLKIITQPQDTDAFRNILQQVINTTKNRIETFYMNNYELICLEQKGVFTITMLLALLNNVPSNEFAA